MRRLAIIIANDGGKQNYLTGVQFDIDNYRHLLRMNEGGAWENEEILVYRNESKADIFTAISGAARFGYEYLLLIFTGHGYCDIKGTTFFELNPRGEECTLQEIKPLVGSVPTLFISDSCSAIPRGRELILEGRTSMFSQGGRFISRNEYKKAYNGALSILQKGTFVHASSCSFGQKAADTDFGGIYSLTLFLTADALIKNSTESEIISIGWIHNEVRKIVNEISEGKQTPTISGIYRGTTQPPLLVMLS